MKTLMRISSNAFAIIILATGILTTNAAPGDLYVSANGVMRFAPDGTSFCFACDGPTSHGLALGISGCDCPGFFGEGATVYLAVTFPAGRDIFFLTPNGHQGIWDFGPLDAEGMAFDSLGFLYVAGDNGIIKYSPTTAGCPNCTTRSTFASGLQHPYGLAFDRQDNLFVADGQSILEFTPAGVQSTFASGLTQPVGLAFDSAGNLFVADFGANTIFKFTPAGARSVFATGLNGPFGLAIDFQNNVFEVDSNTNTIFKFTSAGAQSAFATGLHGPTYLAFEKPQCDTPVIQSITATPNTLWPPNQKKTPVAVTVMATASCGITSEKIISVTSNESGDGEFQITGNLSVNLLADRNGTGSGRVYTITVQVSDSSNNTTTGTVNVTVPHDQGQ